MDKKNFNMYLLTYIIVLGFIAITGMLFFKPIPEGASDAVYMIFGAWISGFTGIVSYFFGSSKSSSDKVSCTTISIFPTYLLTPSLRFFKFNIK